jgi:hypothetical protein
VSEYQLVPYTFSVHVKGRPNELRDLSNLDAAGLTVLEFIAQAARAHEGEPRLEEPTSPTAIQIQQISRSVDVTVLTVGSGQRGIRADVVRTRDGFTTTTDVTESDWTNTPVRNVFFAPQGTKGLLLVERVGQVGVVGKLQKMLSETLRSRYPDLSFVVAPAMSAEAIEAWAKDARIKSIVLRHTHTKLGESTSKLAGLPFGQVIEFRAPRKQSWGQQLFGGKLDVHAQRTVLTEVVPNMPGVSPEKAAETATQMLEEGWTVALAMRKGHRQRLVQVSTKASITMTFPATTQGDNNKRPEHDDFSDACRAALTELAGDGMSVGEPKLCSWLDAQWEDDGEPWKGVWGVTE